MPGGPVALLSPRHTPVALSQAELRLRVFLGSLWACGLRGVEYAVSDAHAGRGAARRAVFGPNYTSPATPFVTRPALRSESISAPGRVTSGRLAPWPGPEPPRKNRSRIAVTTARKPAKWLQENAPERLSAVPQPTYRRRRMRSSSFMRCGMQQDLKRRTVEVRVYPDETSPERPVALCQSKSTANGPQTRGPASSGNARRGDHGAREFSDRRLRNAFILR